jgi:predicted ATPase
VGPGGVGKTALAVALAHDLLEAFAGAVLFVDLGMLSDPDLVPMPVASMLGISVQSGDPMPGLIAYLRDKRMLLILDNCEHLIEAAANLATRIFLAASQLHILATSREVLRVGGEHVYKLAPLTLSPDEPGIPATIILECSAIRLFVERAEAGGARFDLSDVNVAILSDICRKLDGVPLAIELAAGRVGAYGLQQTAALLDQRLTLLWQGQRTAPPRQKSLQATLDWSYELLSELERVVLRGLAIFVGTFTLEAALVVVASPAVDRGLVFGAIDSLIAKSLVAARPVGAMMCYRLLETTRAYILEMSIDGTEFIGLAARHATYYRKWLEQDGAKWPALSNAAERAPYLTGLGNVRTALEWCFGSNGNVQIGIELAAAAVPVFLVMSLLNECRRWSERALFALDVSAGGSSEEMHLQAALGMSLMLTEGTSKATREAIDRSLAIAEERGDALNQLRLLSPLHTFLLRVGDFKTALHYAKRGCAVACSSADSAAIASTHYLLGNSLHHTGDLNGARIEFEAALQHGAGSRRIGTAYLSFGHHLQAASALARNFWLQGLPAQAVKRTHQAVNHAASTDLPIPLSIVLSLAVSVFLWTGDLQRAEEHLDWFLSLVETNSLGPYLAIGLGFKGELAIRRGDANSGVESLQACLGKFRAARFEVSTTPSTIPLVQGFTALSRYSDGIALIDETIRRTETNGELIYMPELLRVKGDLLLRMPGPHDDEAQMCFNQSLALSRSQGALSWELRTTTNLAALWRKQGRVDEARGLLAPVYGRFTEGFDTADLRAAKCLLDELT